MTIREYFLLFLVNTFYGHTLTSDITLTASPSSKIIAGTRLHLSCYVRNPEFSVLWSKSGSDIGENCNIYKKDNGISCTKSENTFVLVIDAVSLVHAGLWSCQHGPKTYDSLIIHVIVPAFIQPPKVYPAPTVRTVQIIPAQHMSPHGPPPLVNSKPVVVGAGTRNDPIDLTGKMKNSVTEVLLQCRTTCSSLKHYLNWKAKNSTAGKVLRPYMIAYSHNSTAAYPTQSDLVPAEARCTRGLYSVVGHVWITCQSDRTTSQSNPSNGNLLVGLNRITCQANHDNEQAFVEESIRDTMLNPFALGSITGSNNRRFTEECYPTQQQIAVCLYILCPGDPVPWFTVGERAVMACSIPVVILLCLLLCYLTRQRRLAKRKANFAPGQRHEIEIML